VTVGVIPREKNEINKLSTVWTYEETIYIQRDL
jgi:hypothetical protein